MNLTLQSLDTQASGHTPGGPYRRTPERRRRPDTKSPGCRSGSSTVSRMAALTLARPPTSSHRTSGMDGAPICAPLLRQVLK